VYNFLIKFHAFLNGHRFYEYLSWRGILAGNYTHLENFEFFKFFKVINRTENLFLFSFLF
jgi:hypothetical protein